MLRPRRWSLLLLLLALPLACDSPGVQRSAPTTARAASSSLAPDVEKQIKDQCLAMEAAFKRGDMLAVASYYADDGKLVSPSGKETTGREAIDAYWQRFSDPVDWRLETFGLEGSGALVIQRGRSILRQKREGKLSTSTVEFMLVWRRVEGGPHPWQISVDAYWSG